MATQGIVSVCVGGAVVFKVVAGSDGYNADRLAGDLRLKGLPGNRDELYERAVLCEFGGRESLVVLDRDGATYRGSGELSSRYRDTFNDPEFNPRWESGTADHVRVLNW